MATVYVSKPCILYEKLRFYELTRPLVIFCKFLGLFPLSNLKKGSHKNVRFVLKSPYVIACGVTTFLQTMCMLLSFLYLFIDGLTPRNSYKFTTCFGGATISVLLLLLARSWPRVLNAVAAIEASLPRNGTNQKNVYVVCYVIVATLILCTLAELVFYATFYMQIAEACGFGSTLMESYYYYTLPWMANFFSYHPFIAYAVQILNIQTSLIIVFADVIIISVSVYLTSRFRELNALVVNNKDKSPRVWGKIRVHYCKLVHLVKILDHTVGSLIIVSFGLKLAVICVHLFKILRKDSAHQVATCNPDKIKVVLASVLRIGYLVFALGQTIGRALMTSLLGAGVHNTARASISVMYEVPTRFFNTEAQRFLDQMYTNKIALSGHHLFYLTQNMIRSMVLSIITFELALMQFTKA